MTQTSYSINIPPAVAGQLVDAGRDKYSESFLNETVAGLGFGLAVVRGASAQGCKIPTAAGQVFIGVSLKTDAVMPSNSGNVGYPYQRAVNVLRKGRVWVLTSGTVAEGENAYFNVVTGQFGGAGSQTETGTYLADGGNTGNFTCSAVVVTPGTAVKGIYVIEFTAATEYEVYDPNGSLVGVGNTGVAFNKGGLAFTITAGGTAAVSGDGAKITVAATAGEEDRASRCIFRSATIGSALAILEINTP